MKKYLPWITVLVLLSVILLPQYSNVFKSIAKPSKTEQKINSLYENKLKTINAKTFDGKDIDGKKLQNVVILNFWASWCQPCLEEFPSLVELRKNFKNEDLSIVAISSDKEDSEKELKKVIKKFGLNFDIIPFSDGKIIDEFMIQAIPITIVFSKGKVQKVYNGGVDFNSEEFKEQIRAWLK